MDSPVSPWRYANNIAFIEDSGTTLLNIFRSQRVNVVNDNVVIPALQRLSVKNRNNIIAWHGKVTSVVPNNDPVSK
jgi:hypothetical protein